MRHVSTHRAPSQFLLTPGTDRILPFHGIAAVSAQPLVAETRILGRDESVRLSVPKQVLNGLHQNSLSHPALSPFCFRW